jgi:predicted nucleic acid-binding protein
MPFVLDASATLAWHFDDETLAAAEVISERSYVDQAVVPHHWLLEVTSALLKGERRGRSKPAASALFLRRLRALDLEVEASDPDHVYDAVFPLARAHRLSVYDAAYLELAGRRGLPLATLDGPLAAAARAVGLETIGGS